MDFYHAAPAAVIRKSSAYIPSTGGKSRSSEDHDCSEEEHKEEHKDERKE
jgi:hypothetical protein